MSFAETLEQAKDAAADVAKKREALAYAKDRYDAGVVEAKAAYDAAVEKAKTAYEEAVSYAKRDYDALLADAKLAFEEGSKAYSEALALLQKLRAEVSEVLGDVAEPSHARVSG